MTTKTRLSRHDEALDRLNSKATVNVYDAMAVLGLGEVTVRRAIANGDIATIRLGHRIHVLSAPLRKQLGLDS
ncbi:DeoR family transcriptional regulator [uncultured Microbacterium sp.]|uniref:DeoR family transcriptional regulator n=1 Tax=uncultured Microbacterium sp. TaxID=191216 RepID=UPI0028D78B1A|nr:DeoR family transcriptional regulator [uncultured Microbacterium sp.]